MSLINNNFDVVNNNPNNNVGAVNNNNHTIFDVINALDK